MSKIYQNGTWHYLGYSLDDLPLIRDQTRSSAPPLSMMQLRDALKRLPSTTIESKSKTGRRTTKSSPGPRTPPEGLHSAKSTKSIIKRNRSASDVFSANAKFHAPPQTEATSSLSAPSAAPRLSLNASRSLSNISHPIMPPSKDTYFSYSRSYTTHPSISLQLEASDNETTPEITFFEDNASLLPSKMSNSGPLISPGQSSSSPTSPTVVAPLVPPLNSAPYLAMPVAPLYGYNQVPQHFPQDCMPSPIAYPDFTPPVVELPPIGDSYGFRGEDYFHHYDPTDSGL